MENKKALLGLFLGVVLLSVFSLTLGHLSTNSPTLSQGLEQSQSAAAWWAQYPPVPGTIRARCRPIQTYL